MSTGSIHHRLLLTSWILQTTDGKGSSFIWNEKPLRASLSWMIDHVLIRIARKNIMIQVAVPFESSRRRFLYFWLGGRGIGIGEVFQTLGDLILKILRR